MKTLTFDPSLYVVVPREPTREMLEAAFTTAKRGWREKYQSYGDLWKSMLAAAPPLPEQPSAPNTNLERNIVQRFYIPPSKLPTPLPEQPQGEPDYQSIVQAVARGWCNKANENKEMDPALAFAIANEVFALRFSAPAAGAAAPATAPDEHGIVDHEISGVKGGGAWTDTTRNGPSSIRAAGAQAVKPAVSASVDLRNRARNYLALAEKATPGPWTTERPFDDELTSIAAPDVPGQGSPNIIATCLYNEEDHEETVEAIHNAAFIAASHEAAAIIRALLNEAKP